jgi:hypothetical protein
MLDPPSYLPQGTYIEYTYKTQMDYQTSVGCRLPENNLTKVETFWSLIGLYVKVYILIPVHLFDVICQIVH